MLKNFLNSTLDTIFKLSKSFHGVTLPNTSDGKLVPSRKNYVVGFVEFLADVSDSIGQPQLLQIR
jgi:hypothetical protein